MTIKRFAAALLLMALVTGAWLPLALAAEAGQPVLLQLKGQPGQEDRYAVNFELTANLQVLEPVSGTSIFSFAPSLNGYVNTLQRIEEVAPNGDLTLSSRIEAFTFNFEAGDLSGNLKLGGPENSPARFPRLPEIPIQAVLSPRGTLVSLAGLEKLPLPAFPTGPEGEKIDFKEVLPKLIKAFSQPMFSDKPVQPGETWETSFIYDSQEIMDMMGMELPPEAAAHLPKVRFPITITYTFTGMEMVDGVSAAVIHAVSPFQLNMPIGPPGQGAPQMELVESGNTTMDIYFDVAAGRMVKKTSDFQMEISVGSQEAKFMQMTMQGSTNEQLVAE